MAGDVGKRGVIDSERFLIHVVGGGFVSNFTNQRLTAKAAQATQSCCGFEPILLLRGLRIGSAEHDDGLALLRGAADAPVGLARNKVAEPG